MLHCKGRFSAYTVYLIYSCANALFFALITTVDMIYQVQVAKLNPLQLVLVGTALEITCFLCQVPTGVLADVYSRRLAVIVGIVILGAGFILQGLVPTFLSMVIGDILFGIGATFTDGAEQAWITDEVGVERVGNVLMRSTQIGLLGGLAGAVICIGLATIRLNIPIVLGGSCYVLLAVFLWFCMPERNFQPRASDERVSWRDLRATFTDGIRLVRVRPVLLTILLVGLFYGLYSEGFDRLSTAHWLQDFMFPTFWHLQAVVWLGSFRIAGTLLTLIGTEFVRRYVDTNKPTLVTRVLFLINALMVAGLLVFALTGNFLLAIVAYLGFTACRSMNTPVFTTWLTQNIDAKVRATVISLSGQVDALGQIVGGPPVGYIGDVFSIRAALVLSSILLSPVLLLFALASRKGKATSVDAQPGGDVEPQMPELV